MAHLYIAAQCVRACGGLLRSRGCSPIPRPARASPLQLRANLEAVRAARRLRGLPKDISTGKEAAGVACYHISVKPIKRSEGRSACAAAAYRSGERLRDDRRGIEHDYSRRRGVDREHCEVMLPDGAPERWRDRSTLWNEVEAVERRRDAQLAREVEIALPRELGSDERFELARSYAQREFVDRGMVADLCVHDKGDGNPHAHIMLTTRNVEDGAFGGKERAWNDRSLLKEWRDGWEREQNLALERAYERERTPEAERSYVDCRSYRDRGMDREPTVHEGHRVRAAEERERQRCEAAGVEYEPVTTVARANAAVRERNSLRELVERAMEEASRAAERARKYMRELVERAHERMRAEREAQKPEREPQREASISERIDELKRQFEREHGRKVPTFDELMKDKEDLERLRRRGISPERDRGSLHERAEAARAEAERQDREAERARRVPTREVGRWLERDQERGRDR